MLPCQPIKFLLEEVTKPILLCSHLGRLSGEKIKKFTIAPLAKVVEGRLGSPMQLMLHIINSEVEQPTLTQLLERSSCW